MSKLSTFLSYRTGDQIRLLSAVGLLLSLPTVVSTAQFARTRTRLLWMSERVGRLVPGNPTPERIVQTIEVVDRALPGERTCLVRSLTAETLLRLYDYRPIHRIGVEKESDQVKAHSWLEHQGEILIGDLDDLSRYEALPPLNDGGTL
ncbi:lasso peptide biosynthesis B2 protein [Halogeometricum sp. S1BR25-6]|uniref:Lasso peptide biosynthesis B2 protein n=1 Tax=Halogeometricum salsisoli TaxID=2950536 RepID=A0ABU2GJ90_9EURY|nr:lasso peptide biosynthesis B2 protein [Halogeometricum sp. S1BR25-6]MDS0300234.1 lasso peptide biosynthesis B2 protein [Halogeometricum sp. S1BR25-6]